MADVKLTQIQLLFLEALKDGSKESGELIGIVRDRLNQIKAGNTPQGATGRSQMVLDELEKDGYIVVESKKFFGGKKYALTDKGRQVLG